MILDYVKESLSLSLSLGERGGGEGGITPCSIHVVSMVMLMVEPWKPL